MPHLPTSANTINCSHPKTIDITYFLNRQVLVYLIKFIGAFVIIFYGTEAIIGLSTPEGRYSSFVDKYLDFIPALRHSLLQSSKYFLGLFGYDAYQSSGIHLSLVGGGSVQLVYSCLGYGVTGFWLAFVFANNVNWKMKLVWMIAGTALLYVINVIRISLTLLGNSQKWQWPFGWGNHTWFNIVAYAAIFCMIYFFDKTLKVNSQKNKTDAGKPGTI